MHYQYFMNYINNNYKSIFILVALAPAALTHRISAGFRFYS